MSDHISLGSLVIDDQGRDAVHVAIVPVTSKKTLAPGEKVKLVKGSTNEVQPAVRGDYIGVVDPYLENSVKPGEKFLLCLRPNSVTSMKHHWSHPSFPSSEPVVGSKYTESEKQDARNWLEDFATEVRMTYSELLEAASAYLDGEIDSYCLGFDTPDRCWSDHEVLWANFEIVTGRHVPESNCDNFFRCAC